MPYEKIGKETRCIADEIPFEIPGSWEWVTFRHIAITELGKTLDKAKNQGTFRPYLCSINVYWTGIDLSKVKQAKFENDELERFLLQKGDLLVCEGGDIGRCAIWDSDQTMYYQNALHRIRFFANLNSLYFRFLLECYKGIGIIDQYSKGMMTVVSEVLRTFVSERLQISNVTWLRLFTLYRLRKVCKYSYIGVYPISSWKYALDWPQPASSPSSHPESCRRPGYGDESLS